MGNYLKNSAAAFVATLALASASTASASSLLSTADQAQLAAWLGEGSVALNNIYTKSGNDTAVNFHKAADGKGRTFTVLEATNEKGQTWLVGGYNPQSWASKGGYHQTPEQADRTAFIFNLTSGLKRLQTPVTYALGSVGATQTFNDLNTGPTFGIGNDLMVFGDLSHGLSSMYSYIDPVDQEFNTSLLDGTTYVRPNITFGRIEVYTISAVPEPSSMLMMGAGLGLLVALRRRKA